MSALFNPEPTATIVADTGRAGDYSTTKRLCFKSRGYWA